MGDVTAFPTRLIVAGSLVSGVLLAIALHLFGQRIALDLAGLWRGEPGQAVPAGAALAWWLIATAGFAGGYYTATLMNRAASGALPPRMRQFLIALGFVVLAAAGQAASAPNAIPTMSGVIAAFVALALGALMAFCGCYFALRRR